MKKITVQLGNYDGSLRNITFLGDLLKTIKDLDYPDDERSGTSYDLYHVKKGYRVYEKRWTNGKGTDRQNYAKLSKVLSEDELLEEFPFLANAVGIFETKDLDNEQTIENEKTVLLAVNEDRARLLPYTLASVEELIDLGYLVLSQDDVSNKIKGKFKSVIGKFED